MFSLINIISLLILLNKKIMGFTVTVMTMVPLAEYFLYDLKFFSLDVPALDVFKQLSLTVGEELLYLEITMLFNGEKSIQLLRYICKIYLSGAYELHMW